MSDITNSSAGDSPTPPDDHGQLDWWLPGASMGVKIGVFLVVLAALAILIAASMFVIRKLREKESVMVLMRKAPSKAGSSPKQPTPLPCSEWAISEERMADRVARGSESPPSDECPLDKESTTSLAELGLVNRKQQPSSSGVCLPLGDTSVPTTQTRNSSPDRVPWGPTCSSQAASPLAGDTADSSGPRGSLGHRGVIFRPLLELSPRQLVLSDEVSARSSPAGNALLSLPVVQRRVGTSHGPSSLLWYEGAAASQGASRREESRASSGPSEEPLYGTGACDGDIERRLRVAYLEALGIKGGDAAAAATSSDHGRQLGTGLVVNKEVGMKWGAQGGSGGQFVVGGTTELLWPVDDVRGEAGGGGASECDGSATVAASEAAIRSGSGRRTSDSCLDIMAGVLPVASRSTELPPKQTSPPPLVISRQAHVRSPVMVAGPLSITGLSSRKPPLQQQQQHLFVGQLDEEGRRGSQPGGASAGVWSGAALAGDGLQPLGRGLGIGSSGFHRAKATPVKDTHSWASVAGRDLQPQPLGESELSELETRMCGAAVTDNPLWTEVGPAVL